MDLSIANENKIKSQIRESSEEHTNKVRKCLVKHIIVEPKFLGDPRNDLQKKIGNTPSQSPIGVDVDNRESSRLLLKRKASTPLQTADILPIDLTLDSSQYHLPPDMHIKLKNVVGSFRLGCLISLKYVAQHCMNVEYKKGQNFLRIRLRKPFVMATIWHTGSASIMGATSKAQCHKGARRISRIIQGIGYKVRMHSFLVVNVVCSFFLPFTLHVYNFAIANLEKTSAEPQMNSCLVYNLLEPRATFFIHQTGSGTASSTSVEGLYTAVESFYRIAVKYAIPRTRELNAKINRKKKQADEQRFMEKAKNLTISEIFAAPENYWEK